MTLAGRFSMALSRVVVASKQEEEDDDVTDLIQLIEELNSHNDLTVKLNN